MSRSLNVWWANQHVGLFTETNGHISFQYDDTAPHMPISLSLPRDGGWQQDAPANFLENLLPTNRKARYAMMDSLHKDSIDPFDLLDRVDATGGLIFSSSDIMPDLRSEGVEYVDDGTIAKRIRAIRRMGSEWWEKDQRCRFSIAGGQGKFTLTRLNKRWAWPNAGMPSTHIFKPDSVDYSNATYLEHAGMHLADLCGLQVPHTTVATFEDEQVYVVERFDRRIDNGQIQRLHMEDLQQALGRPMDDMYSTTSAECVNILRSVCPDDALAYQWIQQLAFNVSIGNCDAHAKNYSLMLNDDAVKLSPMYDAMPTRYWIGLDQELAMPIGDAEYAEWVDRNAWAKLARECDLDEQRVVDIATDISDKVWERFNAACVDMPSTMKDKLFDVLKKVNTGMWKEKLQ